MIEPAIVVVRLLQYTGAAILMGSSLFFLFLVPGGLAQASARRMRALLAVCAALLAVASLLAVALQGGLFAGSLGDGFTADSFTTIVSSMSLGTAAVVRAACAALALILLLALPPRRAGLCGAGLLGAGAAASLAWMGHGASRDGWVPLAADVVHALAASLWIGALLGFVLLLADARGSDGLARLKVALDRFSALGLPLVALLVLSGLANVFYIVGLAHLGSLPFTPYGRLLLTKLAAFAAMLLLAALNRWRLTPALGKPGTLGSLSRSIGLEAALGLTVLALVAWLGTLEPFA